MRKQRFYTLEIVLAIFTLFTHSDVFCQASVISNTSSNISDYIGWNTVPTFDLDLKHEGNHRLVFGTNGTDHLGVLTNVVDGRVVYNTATPINNAQLSIKADFPVSGISVAMRATQLLVSPLMQGILLLMIVLKMPVFTVLP